MIRHLETTLCEPAKLSPGGVNEKCEWRVDDVLADGDGALHAVAGHAPARARARTVRIRRTRATFAEAWLRRKQPRQGLLLTILPSISRATALKS